MILCHLRLQGRDKFLEKIISVVPLAMQIRSTSVRRFASFQKISWKQRRDISFAIGLLVSSFQAEKELINIG